MDDDEAMSEASSSGSSRNSPFEPRSELLAEYETLLSSTFELDTLPAHPLENEEHGRVMTKAEKQNAKKRRRKERDKLAKLQSDGGGNNHTHGTHAERGIFYD